MERGIEEEEAEKAFTSYSIKKYLSWIVVATY